MLAEIWKNLFPWDDLNAKGPPERWLKLGLEILPSLAILVAQNPAKPKLLTADLMGQLLTSANISPSVQAVVLSAAGQPTILLPDTSIFHPNDAVNVSSGMVNGPVGTSTVALIKTVQQGSITLQSNLIAKCDIGDVVTRLGIVGMFGGPQFVAVAAATQPGNLVLPSQPKRISVTVANGATATLIAGVAGKQIALFGVQIGTDATVGVNGMNIQDSAGGQFWNLPLAAGPQYADFDGSVCAGAGLGIALNNSSAASVVARGTMAYGQG